MKRRRSSPCRASSQRSGSSPYSRSNSLSGSRRRALLEFARAAPRRRQVPLRRQARRAACTAFKRAVLVQQRPVQQPVEQRVAVGRRQDRRPACRRCAGARIRRRPPAGADRDCPRVTVAASPKARIRRSTFERIGSAIDQIADEPEPVAIRRRTSAPRAAHRAPSSQPCTSPIAYSAIGAPQEPTLLVQHSGHRQPERRDRRIELLSVIGHHLIAALHGADRRFDDGAARVAKSLARASGTAVRRPRHRRASPSRCRWHP